MGTRNYHQVKEHWRLLSGYYKERSAAKYEAASAAAEELAAAERRLEGLERRAADNPGGGSRDERMELRVARENVEELQQSHVVLVEKTDAGRQRKAGADRRAVVEAAAKLKLF